MHLLFEGGDLLDKLIRGEGRQVDRTGVAAVFDAVIGLVLGHDLHAVGEVADALDDTAGFDAVLAVVGLLNQAAAICLADSVFHRFGHPIGVENRPPLHMPGCAAHGLNES